MILGDGTLFINFNINLTLALQKDLPCVFVIKIFSQSTCFSKTAPLQSFTTSIHTKAKTQPCTRRQLETNWQWWQQVRWLVASSLN